MTSESLSRIAPDAEFIGAGDEVAIIAADGQSFDQFGILVDVDGTDATVNVNGHWVVVAFASLAHCDSPQAEAVASFGVRTPLDVEPTTCPLCGSDDLGVFAADEDREDEADLVECERCHWTAALTAEGVASLNEH